MTKWIIAVGVVLALVGVLLWQVMGPSDARVPTKPRRMDGGVSRTADADVTPRARDADAAEVADSDSTGPKLLGETSPEFNDRIDVIIPNRFRAEASKCYTGGGNGDRKLKLEYKLHIVDGLASATDIRVKESNIGDPALEKCLIEAIRDVRFKQEDMPDHTENTELFIRLRTLKKYKPVEEQIREKERNQTIPEEDDGDAPETE